MSRFTHHGVLPSVPFEDLPPSVAEMAYYNLAQLKSRDFHDVSANESHGGNAGSEIIDGKRYMGAAINGYSSLQSGRFAVFGNFQFLDREIIESPHYDEITVRMGSRHFFDESGFNYEKRVLDLITPSSAEFDTYAMDAMLGAVMLYNEQQYLHTRPV